MTSPCCCFAERKKAIMPNGHIAHAHDGGYHVLRYFGRVDYMLAPSIQRFTDGLIGHEKISALIFDLTEAEYLDSTNLGLLARLAERIRESAGASSVIVSENDDINCVLRSMGFEQIVDILASNAVTCPKSEAHD